MKLKTLKPRVKNADLSIASKIQGTKRMRGGNLQRRNRRMEMRPEGVLCPACLAEGRVTQGQEWDHIVPLCEGGPDTPENLQHLCKPHHKEKTALEAQRRARY